MKKPAGLVPPWVQIPPPALVNSVSQQFESIYKYHLNCIMAEKILIGKVTHYYPKIGVAVVELHETLKKGDKIEIEGKTTKLSQIVTSMQLNHIDIETAGAGQTVGVKVVDRVREGDSVYKVVE